MSTNERNYPAPVINLETAPFWAAANEGILLLKRCETCGEVHFYPRAVCPHCLSLKTQWFKASGKASIYSFSVMRRVEIPYVIAYVSLSEGVTVLSNIVDVDIDQIAINDKVEVTFRRSESGQFLPVFRPENCAQSFDA